MATPNLAAIAGDALFFNYHTPAGAVPVLRGASLEAAPGEIALYYHSETTPVTPLLWGDLAGKVRILATQLRRLGVRPGDRVASTLPNIPEAVIAMLAVTSIGAIWTSVSPDFGWRGVLDRFRQLQPTALICTAG